MAVKVNRPPEIELPPALKELGLGVINYFEELSRYNLQMFTRTGGATDAVAEIENATQNSFTSITQDLSRRIGTGLEFTIDTSGFTTDTSLLTTDKAAI